MNIYIFPAWQHAIVKGSISKTHAGFLTYDVDEAEADLVFPVVSAIKK